MASANRQCHRTGTIIVLAALALLSLRVEGEQTRRIFVVGAIPDPEHLRSSYSVILKDAEDIAHARSLIAYNRKYQKRYVPGEPWPRWTHEQALVGAEIIYMHQPVWENRDYFQPGAPPWSWRAEFIGFGDYSSAIDDVNPAWVECCGEAAGQRAIGAWSYTILAEVPLSYEASYENGMKHGWFGWYYDRNYPWVYQREHQWIYIHGLDPANIWIWDQAMGHLWTSESHYPWFWSNRRQDWLYYQKESHAPRWFYSHKQQGWINLVASE